MDSFFIPVARREQTMTILSACHRIRNVESVSFLRKIFDALDPNWKLNEYSRRQLITRAMDKLVGTRKHVRR